MSTTYEVSGQTTEWEEILINKGIRTREEVYEEKGLNLADYTKPKEVEIEQEQAEDKLERLSIGELDDLLEDDEYSDNHMIEHYRKQRLAEMKQAAVKNRFGELLEISKVDWVREVTEGSKACAVVVHLYENALVECQLMDEVLAVLAAKFRYIKFLRIKYDHAIENWPQRNLPTLFVYENGALKTQLMTLKTVGGLQMNAVDVEWFLAQNGVITDSELERDPRDEEVEGGGGKKSSVRVMRGREEEEEEEEEF